MPIAVRGAYSTIGRLQVDHRADNSAANDPNRMRWPVHTHIFFDCDSTLTSVEGIDALAELKGKGWRVSVLTRAAMGGEVDLEDVYRKRLRALKPTRGQVQALRTIYKQNQVPDAREVIGALQYLGHEVYVISGGLAEPVIEFGLFLGVPRDHIRAVAVEYDRLSGAWWHNVHEQPNVEERYLAHEGSSLTASGGKSEIVRELRGDGPGRSLLVGDGVSDLLASDSVDLFVGYGGVVVRDAVAEAAPVFVRSASLAPVLALAAGPESLKMLEGSSFTGLVTRARAMITEGAITFRDEQLNQRFKQAYQAFYPGPD
jgi:phosphoserine phosphatase